MSPATAKLTALDATVQLSAEVRDQNGQVMSGATVTWASSASAVATVSASGLVTAVANGSATITATAGSVSGSATVTVAQAVSAVAVTPDTATVLKGDTLRLAATATDANGQVVTGAELAWASGDTAVAVVDASGLVTGVAAGQVQVTATAAGLTGRAELAVVTPLPTTVAVTPDTVMLTAVGQTAQLTAEVRDQAGRVMDGTMVTWSSGDRLVATVDREGLVTAAGSGTATITAMADSASAKAVVTVRLPLPERDVLVALYNSTDGPNWVNSENWLTDAPLGDWYGVDTDASGQVVGLDLGGDWLHGHGHGLSGGIPPELGDLVNLQELVLNNNDLTGAIPTELGTLANLRELDLRYNDLTGAIPPELGDLESLERLTLHENYFSGGIPPELGDLANLRELDLRNNDLSGAIPPELGGLPNLEIFDLASNRLTGAIPPELGGLVSLRILLLASNWRREDDVGGFNPGLIGAIPPELGNLRNLESLSLYRNGLRGTIPPELGSLANLVDLVLGENELTGTIPPELGSLANLKRLNLRVNDLVGAIPPELGSLANLDRLHLNYNDLTGAIPPELGSLASLTELDLNYNDLTGAIPPELGSLANLEELGIARNRLSGPVPPEFGGLAGLLRLELSGNDDLAGVLPASLTSLHLESLLAGRTDLCAPTDPTFMAWLRTIRIQRIARCGSAEETAYLVQAIQSRSYTVPLVAGERALLRVFVTAGKATNEGIPPVRARFFLNETERHVVDIPAKSPPIPTEVDEGDLAKSANAEIPGWIVRPGLKMVIEIDPEGTLDPDLGVPERMPKTGRMAVQVNEMPLFDLTMVPFLWRANPDSAVLEVTEGMAADPEGHELLELTRILLPVGELDVTAHDPVVSWTNNTSHLMGETQALWVIEGRRGHYMGMMSGPITGIRGLGASPPWRHAFSVPNAYVIAHELGHNMSLGHAPCGTLGDPNYPDPEGSIGAWGYDFRTEELVPPWRKDLMSYCGPIWIGEYYFSQALRHRLFDEGGSATAVPKAPAESLLLWGGFNPDGNLFLNPAFVVDAPAALPDSTGDYTLTGRDAGGDELFSLSFAMPELSEEEGGSSFAFVLPVQPGWADTLSSITLSGPDGDATLDADSDRPMAILRDPRNGQVRGFVRDLPPTMQAAMEAAGQAAEPGLEVLFSRGIPDATAWRR